jgi:hypothetical protein
VRARLACAITAAVTVRFRLSQTNASGGTTTASDTITTSCTTGSEILLFSDLLFAFDPGSAHATVSVSTGQPLDSVGGMVTIQPNDVVRQALEEAIAADPAVFAELVSAIMWRVAHNPTFRARFAAAIWSA